MKKINLMIVDDEPEIANALMIIFKPNKRYKVRAFTTVEELREAVQQYPPHELICDYLIPGHSGLEVIQELTAEFPRLRSVLLTGQELTDEIIHTLEAGAIDHYVGKPWNLPALTETVQQLARAVAVEL